MALMLIGAAFAEGNPPIATIEMADDGVEYVAEKIQ